MEQWKQILMASVNSEEVSILDADVTGIKGTQEAPDGVFYSEFSEEEALAYHKIFINFSKMYSINDKIAISGLEDDLNAQNAAVIDKFCPIELILFSSRCIGNIVASDTKVFKLLKKVVGKLLNNEASKIAHYILGGWEWKTQISIFVEAIGIAAPDLVDTTMSYYPQAAALCADDDKSLLKSYINMLLATQDESFAEYFSDVVTNDIFMNDTELIGYFCNVLPRDPYWKNEVLLRQITDEIEGQAISPILRKRIAELKRQHLKDESRAEYSIHEMLNSRNVDYETKVEWANKLLFAGACASDVFEWEMVRDPEASILVNRRGMENIDNIMPDEVRGRAYIALATHGKRQRDEIISFLLEQKENNPHYSLPINIALYDLRVLPSEDLFLSLFAEGYKDFYGKNLGKYFRYNKVAIANDFMSFLKRYLKPTLDENTLGYSLTILYHVLDQFNAKDGKIADETLGIADNMMPILLAFEGEFKHSNTYNSFMDILDLIAKESPSNKPGVLKILDKFKHYVSRSGNMPSIEFRINADIRKLDGIAAPQ